MFIIEFKHFTQKYECKLELKIIKVDKIVPI